MSVVCLQFFMIIKRKHPIAQAPSMGSFVKDKMYLWKFLLFNKWIFGNFNQ